MATTAKTGGELVGYVFVLLIYHPEEIDLRCVDIAIEASRRCNFQSMAYDFMFDEEGNPKIGEFSYTYVDSAVQNCPGYFKGSSSNSYFFSNVLGVDKKG